MLDTAEEEIKTFRPMLKFELIEHFTVGKANGYAVAMTAYIDADTDIGGSCFHQFGLRQSELKVIILWSRLLTEPHQTADRHHPVRPIG